MVIRRLSTKSNSEAAGDYGYDFQNVHLMRENHEFGYSMPNICRSAGGGLPRTCIRGCDLDVIGETGLAVLIDLTR